MAAINKPDLVMVSKTSTEDRDLTISSVKMHIRILQAQLGFLKDTNSMTPEIQDMLSSLVARSPSGNEPLANEEPEISVKKKPEPKPDILPTPETYTVTTGYIGPDVKHVVAMKEDKIVVCGTRGEFALAYNLRNMTAGLILHDYIVLAGSEQPPMSSVYLCTQTRPIGSGAYTLTWTAGDHIRVYHWEEACHKPKTNGIAVNLATRQIGRFVSSGYELKMIEDGLDREKILKF